MLARIILRRERLAGYWRCLFVGGREDSSRSRAGMAVKLRTLARCARGDSLARRLPDCRSRRPINIRSRGTLHMLPRVT